MNKGKFIYPKINIHRFDFETVTTNSAVVPDVKGSYAAGAAADYIMGNTTDVDVQGKQITTFKSIVGFKY